MTTTTSTPATVRSGLGVAMEQSLLIAGRNMRNLMRRPDIVTFIFVQPIIFLLLFIYVLGGAIEIPGLSYTDFAMPGIIVATLIFDAPATAIGLNEDMSKGVLDRFRSLPIQRSAVLVGRLLSDAVRALAVTAIIIGVGYAVGFRFHGGLLAALGVVLLSWLFAVSVGWGSAIIGMIVPSPEAVQAAVFTIIFPVAFLSSVYVPIETMPGPLQAFARVNPITVVSDAVRELSLGPELSAQVGIDGNPLLAAGISVVLIAIFGFLAVRAYNRLP